MFRLALLLLLATAAHADPSMSNIVNLSGSTAVLRPTLHPGAIAEMVFDNQTTNDRDDVKSYRAVLGDLVIPFNFEWQTGRAMVDDAIVLHPPEGVNCLPVDCRMQVKEHASGVLYLFRGQGVGM